MPQQRTAQLPRPHRRAHQRVALLALSLVAFIAALLTVSNLTFAADRSDPKRVGGKVTKAWPQTGKAPSTAHARWLARQVGAIAPKACAKNWRLAQERCKTRRPAARMSAAAGDPGSPTGAVAHIAGGAVRPPGWAGASDASGLKLPLQLVRSYEIPTDDPSYQRLLDWSWTYDSAVSAAAFTAIGDKDNAAQLLDQLVALQHTDGALEIAFDTASGEGAGVYRSGTIAWLGLAAATFDQAFGSTRYLEPQKRTADHLLRMRTQSGLIKGGPDVEWVSTQHNLISYVFLTRLAAEVRATGDTKAADLYQAASKTISGAIDAQLLVSDGKTARFRRGLSDETQSVDVQALGAMYLQGTDQPELAQQVLKYAEKTFAVHGRAIEVSGEKATYNETYSANGGFSGYAPDVGEGAANIIWAEASGEMRLAQAALGENTSALDNSIQRWASITKGSGPLQANRTVPAGAGDAEFHVWPASTAAAWTVLAGSAPTFFAAPLPVATTLVTDWTKVRGDKLITTSPDGRVEMTGAGERRVLGGSARASDYTVTSNVTLRSGNGYGVYVRATVDASTKLTGYAVQMDHSYGTGAIVVREILNDTELGVPIARLTLPTKFAWFGEPHTLGVTVKGNTMSVTLDGSQQLAVPDLAAASSFSVKYLYGPTSTLTEPKAGGIGLRAWGDAQVSLQQMTVGPAQ